MDPAIFNRITTKEVYGEDENGNPTVKTVYTRGFMGPEVAYEDLTDEDFNEPEPI
jgi:hypothetical protein